ncbi:MAG: hypothetical protein GY938_18945 [Ketobacter sp.]|nr:hypothetical protein [Planctomycetota bacterium]MCP5017322.1 hypothetical protein [Ketobacter sp.]
MKRSRHPSKDIEAALQEAEDQGWIVEVGGSHCWGKLKCPTNSGCRGGQYCIISISSTPRSPTNHAKQIKKAVNKCVIE